VINCKDLSTSQDPVRAQISEQMMGVELQSQKVDSMNLNDSDEPPRQKNLKKKNKDLITLGYCGKGSHGHITKHYDSVNRCFVAEKKFYNMEQGEKEVISYSMIQKINHPELLKIFRTEENPYSVTMECGIGSLRDILIFMEEKKIRYSASMYAT